MAKPGQAINQSREQVDGLLNSMSGDVRTSLQKCENQIQSIKHANESEIMRINKAINSLEAKITAGGAINNMSTIPKSAVVRTTAVGQPESTVGTVES